MGSKTVILWTQRPLFIFGVSLFTWLVGLKDTYPRVRNAVNRRSSTSCVDWWIKTNHLVIHLVIHLVASLFKFLESFWKHFENASIGFFISSIDVARRAASIYGIPGPRVRVLEAHRKWISQITKWITKWFVFIHQSTQLAELRRFTAFMILGYVSVRHTREMKTEDTKMNNHTNNSVGVQWITVFEPKLPKNVIHWAHNPLFKILKNNK